MAMEGVLKEIMLETGQQMNQFKHRQVLSKEKSDLSSLKKSWNICPQVNDIFENDIFSL